MICSKLRKKVSSIIVEDENKKDDKEEDSENDENKENPMKILEDEKQETDNEDMVERISVRRAEKEKCCESSVEEEW